MQWSRALGGKLARGTAEEISAGPRAPTPMAGTGRASESSEVPSLYSAFRKFPWKFRGGWLIDSAFYVRVCCGTLGCSSGTRMAATPPATLHA